MNSGASINGGQMSVPSNNNSQSQMNNGNPANNSYHQQTYGTNLNVNNMNYNTANFAQIPQQCSTKQNFQAQNQMNVPQTANYQFSQQQQQHFQNSLQFADQMQLMSVSGTNLNPKSLQQNGTVQHQVSGYTQPQFQQNFQSGHFQPQTMTNQQALMQSGLNRGMISPANNVISVTENNLIPPSPNSSNIPENYDSLPYDNLLDEKTIPNSYFIPKKDYSKKHGQIIPPSIDNVAPSFHRLPKHISVFKQFMLKFGIHLTPMHESAELVRVSSYGNEKLCQDCNAYFNPYCKLHNNNTWTCSICNSSRNRYIGKFDQKRMQPESLHCSIDYPHGQRSDFPRPQETVFAIDISEISKKTGYIKLVIQEIKASLSYFAIDKRSKITLMFINDSITVLRMRSDGKFEFLSIADPNFDDLSFLDGLNVKLGVRDHRAKIEMILDKIFDFMPPSGIKCNFNNALICAKNLLRFYGGNVWIFIALPVEPLPDSNILLKTATNNEKIDPSKPSQQSNQMYKKMSYEFYQAGTTVNIVAMTSKNMDLASLYPLCRITGGLLKCFYAFDSNNFIQVTSFTHFLRSKWQRPMYQGVKTTIHTNDSLSIADSCGNMFQSVLNVFNQGNIDDSASYLYTFDISALKKHQQFTIQFVTTYTTYKAETRVRVHTIQIPITDKASDIYATFDHMSIIGLWAKFAAERVFEDQASVIRENFIKSLVNLLKRFKSMHPSQIGPQTIICPKNLLMLPACFFAVSNCYLFYFKYLLHPGPKNSLAIDILNMNPRQLIQEFCCPFFKLVIYNGKFKVYFETLSISQIKSNSSPKTFHLLFAENCLFLIAKDKSVLSQIQQTLLSTSTENTQKNSNTETLDLEPLSSLSTLKIIEKCAVTAAKSSAYQTLIQIIKKDKSIFNQTIILPAESKYLNEDLFFKFIIDTRKSGEQSTCNYFLTLLKQKM